MKTVYVKVPTIHGLYVIVNKNDLDDDFFEVINMEGTCFVLRYFEIHRYGALPITNKLDFQLASRLENDI